MWHVWREEKLYVHFRVGNLKEGRHVEDLDLDGRIIGRS
jgi:hypothetical protein